MGTSENSLISAFDYAWSRLAARVATLSDDEYFWEPVDDCWNLREGRDGRWLLDGGGGGGPAPQPVPVTTIAWRHCHIGGLALGGFTNLRFGDGTLSSDSIDFPRSAEAAIHFLNVHYSEWSQAITSLSISDWHEPLGPAWDEYANDDTFDLALHVLDELCHHGGEVGVLRDLYALRNRSI
jgi:hypothetical protein